MKPTRAALYARCSTGYQDVGLQVDALRRLAETRGWSPVEVYVDEGVSGAKDSRPALDRMMVDARAGKLDVVAVWKFDRFARSTAHLLAALDDFRRAGVHFVSVTEAIDTGTAVGRMVYTRFAVPPRAPTPARRPNGAALRALVRVEVALPRGRRL